MKRTVKSIIAACMALTTLASTVTALNTNASYDVFLGNKPLFDLEKGGKGYEPFEYDASYGKYYPIFDDMKMKNGYLYRSAEFPTLFQYYRDIEFCVLQLRVTDTDKCKAIFDKYNTELGFSFKDWRLGCIDIQKTINADDFDSHEEFNAAVKEEQSKINENSIKIVDMVAEMNEAGIIKESRYIAFRPRRLNVMNLHIISLKGFHGTREEALEVKTKLEEICAAVGPYFKVYCSDSYSAAEIEKYGYSFSVEMNRDRTVEDLFKLADILYENEYDLDVDLFVYSNAFCNDPHFETGDVYFLEDADIQTNEVDLLAEAEAQKNTVYGDINIDDHIGINDVILLNKEINGVVSVNTSQMRASDLNRDGEINSADLDIMLDFIMDKVDTLPVKD